MKSYIVAASFLAWALFASLSMAAEVPFNQTQFDAVRTAGKPVVVVFHADWCPVCRAQAPVLKELAQSPELRGLTFFIANFDTEKDLKKSLGVAKQSTIVVFKDGREAARSIGDTQADKLASLLRHAIG